MISKILVLCLFALCSCGEDGHVKVYDLPEGSNCTWNGLEGKCTNIYNCQSPKDAIQRIPICSFQSKTPIVCCTISKPNLIIKDPFKEFEVDSRFNQTSKARDNCIKYLRTLNYPCSLPHPYEERSLSDQSSLDTVTPPPLENARYPRSSGDLISTLKPHADAENQTVAPPYQPDNIPAISAGHAAYRRQYPHMALLGYGDDIKTAQWLCGGSVISEKYILTAAHCISSPAVATEWRSFKQTWNTGFSISLGDKLKNKINGKSRGSVKFIALGILKRSDPPELWQTHNVKRIIAYPQYQPPSKYNDIALLETEDTITFNNNILPACLPLVPESDETAEATGWGALGHRQGLADVLQTVKLQRYDEEKCSQLYPKHRHLREGYNHSSQMCYGDTKVAKDTCEGDSGGPLQTGNKFLSCAYTVLGVTSYGRQCGVSAGSGMYTRVYRYVPWIESQVWP